MFFAELNEFFTRELAEAGYSGVEVRKTATKVEIIILATRTQDVLGEKVCIDIIFISFLILLCERCIEENNMQNILVVKD